MSEILRHKSEAKTQEQILMYKGVKHTPKGLEKLIAKNITQKQVLNDLIGMDKMQLSYHTKFIIDELTKVAKTNLQKEIVGIISFLHIFPKTSIETLNNMTDNLKHLSKRYQKYNGGSTLRYLYKLGNFKLNEKIYDTICNLYQKQMFISTRPAEIIGATVEICSCYNCSNNGQYSGSPVTLCTDDTTVIIYFCYTNNNDVEIITHRCYAHILNNADGTSIVMNRAYSNEGVTKDMKEIFLKGLCNIFNIDGKNCIGNEHNYNKKLQKDMFYIDSDDDHLYYDISHNSTYRCIINKNHIGYEIKVGDEHICINCGDTDNQTSNTHLCYDCGGMVCADCGCCIHDDDYYCIDDEYYCCDCVSYCDNCDNYRIENEVYYFNGIGHTVCQCCIDRASN